MIDPSIVVALIANAALIYVAHMQHKTRKKVNATHDQLTVNHHKSEPPTLLDRMDFICGELRQIKQWQVRHDNLHKIENLENE